MKPIAPRLIVHWIVGFFVGTALIAVSSPLFVRTYAPLRTDPIRGTWTLPPGQTYRWRSEGYAETQIGPLGMPGKTSIRPDQQQIRVALWGDSQAEGVCVSDAQKIFAQAQQLSQGEIEVFPLTRSGEDAADWLTQFSAVEKELNIDVHVLLIVDLLDLLTTSEVPVPPPTQADTAQANAAIAARLPAFVIQAAHYLLTEDDGATRRKLRFSVGPISRANAARAGNRSSAETIDWLTPIADVRRATDRPIVILYAPKSPSIIGGKVVMQDASADDFARVKAAADEVGVQVIDIRPELREAVIAGIWPHGFHNGVIGSGHLNATGNKIAASGLVNATRAAIEQGN